MTLPFHEDIVNTGIIDKCTFTNPNFIGYLNKYGAPIDYTDKNGIGGHDNNPTTDLFKSFFYIKYSDYKSNNPANDFISSFKFDDKEKEKIICGNQLNKINVKLENVISNIKFDLKYGRNINELILMKYDLLLFFKNCYLCGSFDQGFGKKIRFMNMSEFYDKIFQYIEQKCTKLYKSCKNAPKYYNFDFQYNLYQNNVLLDLLKEVFICYLGYHSIERIPRTITTSEINIYETFYNYLLNDFTIVQLPRMIFNIDNQSYTEKPVNEFLISEKEKILKYEIQSIKKSVSKNELTKYYR